MKILYLDCGMGAAGDMLGAALLALVDEREQILDTLNAALGAKAVVRAEEKDSCGVRGLRLRVDVGGDEEGEPIRREHASTSIGEIRAFLRDLPLSGRVRADALAVFDSLAEAESAVHGCEMENVHFHELGTIDALSDVLLTCLLMEKLAPERVLASPVNVGGGTVKCAHGVLPVPAPATERLLRGLPCYEGEIKSELCTPTGAALLRHFVAGFGPLPPMRVERCGFGLGKKDFARLNALRAFWGESEESGGSERLVELDCNVDDMTGEEIAFACERLFAAGALDVWTSPIGMKKSRPGVLLSCLGREGDRAALLESLFRHTTTLGVRARPCERYALARSVRTEQTPFGDLRVKRAEGFGVTREKFEYEDLAAAAREQGLSLRELREKLR